MHHCCDFAGSVNRVVGLLILRDPFAVALQMVQELKPQFVNLCRQQRELLDFLIYRLDRLASRMKSSTDMSDAFGSCVCFCYFFGCISLSA